MKLMFLFHRARSLPLATSMCVLALACGGDDSGTGDSGTDSSSGSETAADDINPTEPDTADPDTTSAETDDPSITGPDTTDPDTTGSTTDDPTTTTGDPTDTETGTTGGAAGVCIGIDQVGNLGTVYARDGANIGGGCDAVPAPCGGDVVGTWESTDVCGFEAIPNPLAGQCPGSTFDIIALDQTGTVTFNDDNTFVNELQQTSDWQMDLDTQTCFGVNCATFELFLNMQAGLTATCQDGGLGCQCDGQSMMMDGSQGTYELMGTDVVFTVDGMAQPPSPYCIEGDRLDMWPPLFQSTVTREPCNDAAECEAALGEDFENYACDTGDGGGAAAPTWSPGPLAP